MNEGKITGALLSTFSWQFLTKLYKYVPPYLLVHITASHLAILLFLHTIVYKDSSLLNKENNVFKDALGVKGLGFNHHGNHGSHYGNHHGNYHDNHSNHHCNYHDNHSNHHGNYHAEQLLFSCQFSKVSSCQVVRDAKRY